MGTVGVEHREPDAGSWTMVRRRPRRGLEALVSGYSDYVEARAVGRVQQELPSTTVPLVLNLGARWRVSGALDGDVAMHDSFAAGLWETSAFVSAVGPAACVQVNLTPIGAYMLFGVPMHELAGRTVDLDELLPGEGPELAGRLADVEAPAERFALLDDALARHFAGARRPSADVLSAWVALERSAGRVSIGRLAELTGRSRRHLVARFKEEVGLPPKAVARILRFSRALGLMRQRPELELAALAFECGYYDQAHMNRDFRSFTGTSPTRLARGPADFG